MRSEDEEGLGMTGTVSLILCDVFGGANIKRAMLGALLLVLTPGVFGATTALDSASTTIRNGAQEPIRCLSEGEGSLYCYMSTCNPVAHARNNHHGVASVNGKRRQQQLYHSVGC